MAHLAFPVADRKQFVLCVFGVAAAQRALGGGRLDVSVKPGQLGDDATAGTGSVAVIVLRCSGIPEAAAVVIAGGMADLPATVAVVISRLGNGNPTRSEQTRVGQEGVITC